MLLLFIAMDNSMSNCDDNQVSNFYCFSELFQDRAKTQSWLIYSLICISLNFKPQFSFGCKLQLVTQISQTKKQL